MVALTVARQAFLDAAGAAVVDSGAEGAIVEAFRVVWLWLVSLLLLLLWM
jgi:hypothetical protein